MNTRRSFTIVSLLMLLSILLAACASTATPAPTQAPANTSAAPATTSTEASQEPITLKFTIWGSQKHIDMINSIAAEYEKTHPNITVQVESIDYGDYFTKVPLELSGNDKPDLGWLVDTTALEWANDGTLADLGPAVKNDPDYDYNDISTGAMGLWVKGDAVYGIPFSTSPYFITYNKDLFAQAKLQTPDQSLAAGNWTWETLAADAKAIAALGKGYYGYEPMDTLDESPWDNLVPVMQAYGGDAWNADGTTCELTQSGSEAGIQVLYNMMFVDKSMVPPGETADISTGKVGMALQQLSRLSGLQGVSFKWDIAPLPSGPAGYKPLIGQAAVVVFNASPHKDAAIDFLKFFTNKENSTTQEQFFPQARKSVLDSGALYTAHPELSQASLKAAVIDPIEQGALVLPSHINAANITSAVVSVFDTMWVPNADINTALGQACDAMQPFLNK